MAIKSAQQLSNNNYFIVLLLITLLVLGVTGLGAKMLVTSIIRDAKVLSAKNKASAQLEKNLDAAPRLVNNYKSLGSTNNLIMDALPSTPDFPGLVAMAENIALESGVTLKSVAPSAGGTTPASTSSSSNGAQAAPQPLNVTLAFDTSYTSFQQLIGNMEASARPFRINSVQLSGSGGSLAVQMDATTYYQDKAAVPFSLEAVK